MKRYLIIILISVFFLNIGICTSKPIEIEVNTPIKALIMYFPSPAIMRCLNHSEIPKKFRKAMISRKAEFPDKTKLIQNITVGTIGKKFVFSGSVISEGKTTPLVINGGPYFGIGKGGEIKSSLFFGLESILDVPKKVYIKDKIGTQELNYETFLKTTKGMVGDVKYNLELSGQDRNIRKYETRYFLNGIGMIGEYSIKVDGKSVGNDNYEVHEKFGPVEVFTTVKVYD